MKKLLLFVLVFTQLAWCMERQPNADYRARREKLAAKTNGSAVLLFAGMEADGPNAVYGFRQDNNFYYLTGWREPGAAVLIVPATAAKPDSPAKPYTEIFFLPNHNYAEEKWTGPKLGPGDPNVEQITGFDKVEAIDNLRTEMVNLLPAKPVYTDIVSPDDTSTSTEAIEWLKRANAFTVGASLQDVRPLLSSLRTVKDDGEIKLIQKAADASTAAQLEAFKAIKPGSSEQEISAVLQYGWNKRGCERPAYAPIVGAGFNSTVLHYSDDDGPIKDGDLVLMDAAGEYSMYASDVTRTVPANGKFTARQREIYEIVLGAQEAAIHAFQSGKSGLQRNSPDTLYKVAFDYINTHGKDSHGQPLGKYFIHGLSHYVGLAVHDDGDYKVPLEPGVVFTIEPGIYIPEEKIGVRIEDDFYVDKDGKLINMTGNLPRTPDDVERAMATK